MNKFFAKYGKTTVFVLMVIVCLTFLVHLLSVSSGYYRSVDNQALDRAENYAGEQAVGIQEQFGALKMRADYCASEVRKATSQADAVERLRTVGTEQRSADGEKFVAALYTKGGAVYGLNEEAETRYPELTELAANTDGGVTHLFQYDNSNMVFGISAPCSTAYMDSVVLLYLRTAVSLGAFVQSSDHSYIPSVQAADFVLLCKHDGIILEKLRVGDAVDPGFGSVTEGLFKQLIADEKTMDRVTTAMVAGKSQAEIVSVGSEKYALSVSPLGSGCAGLVLIGLYDMTGLYGSGHQVLTTIWGTIAFLTLLLIGFVVLAIGDRIRTGRKMKEITTMDGTVGCPNQTGFETTAQEIIDRLRGTQFAVVLLRINNYRYITEQFGDQQNMSVLRFIRSRCAKSMMVSETFGYAGEGRFLLLLHYKEKKALTNRLDGLYLQVARYKFEEDAEYKLNVSYSIYEVDQDERVSVGRMIDKLNISDSGPTRKTGAVSLEFYGDTLRENYLKKAEIEGRMESAFENNEFHIFYQPKYNIKRGGMDGSEILVRWFDTKIDHYRTPNEFLPIFEENGFISRLDRFVFYKACENAANMAEKKQPVYPFSVNVSRVTAIQPDFLEYYKRIKQKFNIRDGFVTIEFTESFAYENYEYLAGVIHELHGSGFQCSLDDFGTGYSSFAVLKDLDFDEIKIDKSLLTPSAHPERDKVLLQSIINLVHTLGAKITQEGIEDAGTFREISEMGCDVMQGYYFSKPMKYSDYREFIAMNRGKL